MTINLNLPQGFECEVGSKKPTRRNPRPTRISVTSIRALLRRSNINWVYVESDGSHNVDAEIIFPPLLINDRALNEYIKPVFDVLEEHGAIIRNNCGGHVHVGIRPVLNIDANEFNRLQINHFKYNIDTSLSSLNSEHFINPIVELGDPIPFTLIKDVIKNYSINQNYISSFLPPSRRNHSWAAPINSLSTSTRFKDARNFDDLKRIGLLGKRDAINCDYLEPTSKQTIEFRQNASTLSTVKLQKWCQFLSFLFEQSSEFRVSFGGTAITRTIVKETPYQHGNGRSFVSRVYDMCRNQNNNNGSTIEEIMSATGAGAQNIRSRISEFRYHYGHQAIITHTQQTQGRVYGDGQIYCRYQILHQYNKIVETSYDARLIDNPTYDIFYGMPLDLKRWIDERIRHFRT